MNEILLPTLPSKREESAGEVLLGGAGQEEVAWPFLSLATCNLPTAFHGSVKPTRQEDFRRTCQLLSSPRGKVVQPLVRAAAFVLLPENSDYVSFVCLLIWRRISKGPLKTKGRFHSFESGVCEPPLLSLPLDWPQWWVGRIVKVGMEFALWWVPSPSPL